MTRCPHCGRAMPKPLGRPRKLDDEKVRALHARGLSLREIAEKLGVTHGAVQAALARAPKP